MQYIFINKIYSIIIFKKIKNLSHFSALILSNHKTLSVVHFNLLIEITNHKKHLILKKFLLK